MAKMNKTLNGILAAVVIGGLMLGGPDTSSAARSSDERGNDYRSDGYLFSQNDRKLKEEIQSELNWSPFVDEENIRVSVRNGVATLSGTVEDRSEMNDAIENAYEGGAKRVINQLQIREESQRYADSRRSENQMSDEQLKKKIERNVKRAPHLRSDRVHARAHNGVVTLHGWVDTEEEMQDLIDRSYDAGARQVISELGVRSGYQPRRHTDRLERQDHPLGITSDSGTFDYH